MPFTSYPAIISVYSHLQMQSVAWYLIVWPSLHKNMSNDDRAIVESADFTHEREMGECHEFTVKPRYNIATRIIDTMRQ
jgi:hypothetical protein